MQVMFGYRFRRDPLGQADSELAGGIAEICRVETGEPVQKTDRLPGFDCSQQGQTGVIRTVTAYELISLHAEINRRVPGKDTPNADKIWGIWVDSCEVTGNCFSQTLVRSLHGSTREAAAEV
ncbi:hypothetical protein [Streptomyces sp. NPDC095817]|uniref:hypothetical protein n=1 Tax=Streptomyces sp. NPDC095817 TaxID=3155082 RepID=UPI003332A4B8